MHIVLKYWPYILAATALIAAYLYVANLKHTIRTQAVTIQELNLSIETQNRAIDDFKSDADKRLKEREAQLKQAQELASQYKKQSANILNRKPTSSNDCKATETLINDFLK
jgi:hypothetical protein